jgi:Trk K+ transport system NAD-binding subunit
MDRDEAALGRAAARLARAAVGDVLNDRFLAALAGEDGEGGEAGEAVAVAIVSLGDLGASLVTVQRLRDLGLRNIRVKVNGEDAARALEALGVQGAIYPDRDAAYELAQGLGGAGPSRKP